MHSRATFVYWTSRRLRSCRVAGICENLRATLFTRNVSRPGDAENTYSGSDSTPTLGREDEVAASCGKKRDCCRKTLDTRNSQLGTGTSYGQL